MQRSAIIIGATGQTGSYLAQELLSNNYKVYCTSRDSVRANWWRLEELNISSYTEPVSLNPHNSKEVMQLVNAVQPKEIYYLAGPSSVASSFLDPVASITDIINPINQILEALYMIDYDGTFFNPSSTDCFGNQPGALLSEGSAMKPVSPYAIAKLTSFLITKQYRESFGLKSRSGILTNHESPLRGSEFVTQKIILGLKKISLGLLDNISLGDISVSRDWMWAGDTAKAIRMIGSSDMDDDYIVASGISHTLQDFIIAACNVLGLEPSSVVTYSTDFKRPSEISSISLDPSKIEAELGWKAERSFEDIVSDLLERRL